MGFLRPGYVHHLNLIIGSFIDGEVHSGLFDNFVLSCMARRESLLLQSCFLLWSVACKSIVVLGILEFSFLCNKQLWGFIQLKGRCFWSERFIGHLSQPCYLQWNLLVEIGISSLQWGTTTVQRMDRNWWCVILMFECMADGRNAVNQCPEWSGFMS